MKMIGVEPTVVHEVLQRVDDPVPPTMLDCVIAAESKIVQSSVISAEWFIKSSRICVYVSARDEISTNDIIREALSHGKVVYIPFADHQTKQMLMLRLRDVQELEELKPRFSGFRQFKSAKGRENALDTEPLDLVILPGVAFSLDGHRLCHQKDTYAHFLKNHEIKFGTKPITVGLALSVQLSTKIPITANEIQIDHVLSVANCPLKNNVVLDHMLNA